MSAPSSRDSADRDFCPAVSRDGRRCDFAEHPGFVHWSWVEGELQFWQSLPSEGETWRNEGATEDPLRDAPQVLIDAALKVRPEMPKDFNPIANIYADPKLALRYLKETEMTQNLLERGRSPEIYDRPLVEGITVSGSFSYGLLEASTEPHGYHVIHETVPESGQVEARAVVHPDSLREVLVPGHRGGCAGDCCREGYSEETSYPECWTWDQIRTGIAEKYRAWKDWAL